MALSTVVLRVDFASSDVQLARAALQKLLDALNAVPASQAGLDDRLAEYVFFPLSHVFRQAPSLPLDILEIASRCLQKLLQGGWALSSDPRLGVQLMILLTFLAGGRPSKNTRTASQDAEDLRICAYESISALFFTLRSPLLNKALLETENVPALGQAVSVMLGGVREGTSAQMQTSALRAFQSFVNCIRDRTVVATFFPGIISTLSHVLTPTTGSRRHFKLLQDATKTMQDMICFILADQRLNFDHSKSEKHSQSVPSELSQSWYIETASKVNLALVNVAKLRRHDRKEVREALFNLCIAILEQCQRFMSQSAVLVVDVIIEMSSSGANTYMVRELDRLASVDETLAKSIRSKFYDRMIALPRTMVSADHDLKHRFLIETTTFARLAANLGLDMSSLSGILPNLMQDAAINLIKIPNRFAITAYSKISAFESLISSNTSNSMNASTTSTETTAFRSVFTADLEKVNQDLLNDFQALVEEVATSSTSTELLWDTLQVARHGQGDTILVNLWISLVIARRRSSLGGEFDRFVKLSDNEAVDFYDDLYSLALSILSRSTDGLATGWRVQALALEAVAFQAQRLQRQFRPELVDSLYPVVHALGSSSHALRNHAIACLNLLASSCEYFDAKDLLVQNVDYLVNAIGVKLNTFDLSPEGPQVLLMIVKICGPSLIPYIDDLVDGIFAALECFHGYTTLVELLFSTLNGIVQEGTKSVPYEALALGDGSTVVSHRKSERQPADMGHFKRSLREQVLVDSVRQSRVTSDQSDTTPHTSWKPLSKPNVDKMEDTGEGHDTENSVERNPESVAATQVSRTYGVVRRIVTLTQHHLPSSSASVRGSLLQLLLTATPYLSAHDDSFLPLIHLLWPVLLPRLDDKEAYVVSGVLAVLGAICEGAGDFVAGRLEALWPKVCKIHENLNLSVEAPHMMHPGSVRGINLSAATLPGITQKSDVRFTGTESSGPSELASSFPYIPTTTHVIRTTLTSFLTQMVLHVRITERMFSVVLGNILYEPLIVQKRDDVRKVLEKVNPDAVWLLMEQFEWDGRNEERSQRAKMKWARRKPADVECAPNFAIFTF